MKKREPARIAKPLTDRDGEVRELQLEDFAAMRPAAEVLSAELLALLPEQKHPKPGTGKVGITLHLDPDVADHFRATGPGWEDRINQALRKLIA